MNVNLEDEVNYSLLFNVTPMPILVFDLETFAILNVNQAALETYGYTRDEFLSLTIASLLTQSDFDLVKERLTNQPNTERRKEIWQHRKKNGEVVPVEITAFTIKMSERCVRLALCNDISERLRQEQQLQEGELYHRMLFENSPLPAFVFDRTSMEFLDVNETAVQNYGYSRDEFLSMTLKELRPPEDIPMLTKLLSLTPQAAKLSKPIRHKKKDGSIIEVEINTFPIVYNQRYATVATAQDVTVQRKLEKQLRENERQYRELYERASDAIYTHDLKGNLTSMNDAGLKILGYSRDELIGINLSRLLPPEEVDRAREMIRRKVNGEITTTVYEVRVITKEGKILPVELSTTVMLKDGQSTGVQAIGVQGIARVLTERKRVEEHFRQAQKMEAVGRLAGGIAHDFNNRLTAIQGFTDLLLKRSEQNDQQRYYLEQIRIASERAAELTRQLLTFSRKQVLNPKLLNLNEVVSDWGNMVRVLLGENIAVHLILGSDIGLVKADPGQLEHVIMNLALNACDAMPSGGDFTIETTDLEVSELQAKFNPAIQPGHYVRLLVKDNGCGMNEETQNHLFEPFFTTKERGKGTGLGLFTAYGIIKQSGGHIEVKSTLGEGTTFMIFLPVIKTSQIEIPPQSSVTTVAAGRETIMVVEDEPTVRKLVCAVLEEAGYTVMNASYGIEAIATFVRNPETIALLLTDVRMPGMDGWDLAEKVRAISPKTRVVFMSAYTDDSRILDAGTDSVFLQKPFSPDSLTRLVREVLDKSDAVLGATV